MTEKGITIYHGLIFRVLVIFFLFSAIIGLPINAYLFIRVLVFLVMIYILSDNNIRNNLILVFCIPILIVFNPFYIFSFSKDTWIIIDLLAILLIVSTIHKSNYQLFKYEHVKNEKEVVKLFREHSLLEKIPLWLRWILLIPLSLIISIIIPYIIMFLFSSYLIGEYGGISAVYHILIDISISVGIVYLFLRSLISIAPFYKFNVLLFGNIFLYMLLLLITLLNISVYTKEETWIQLGIIYVFMIYGMAIFQEHFQTYIASNFTRNIE